MDYDVVFVKETVPLSYGGGGERWLLAIAKGLLKEGLSVCIAELVEEEKYSDSEIEIVNFGHNPLKSVKELFSSMSSTKYYYMPVYAHFVVSVIKWYKGELIVGHHNPWLLESSNVYDRIARKFLKRASLNHCLNRYHENLIKKLGGKTVTLPNKFSLLNPSLERNWKKSDEFTVLFVGRLVKEKGADLLPKIVKRIDRSISIRIIGDGPLKEELKEVLSEYENVAFLGRISDKALIEEYKRAHVLLLPSRYEGSPLVINEALSFGCAVVSSDIPSIRGDLLARTSDLPEKAVLLGTVDTPSEFSEKILWLKDLWENGRWEEVEKEAISLLETLDAYVKEFKNEVLYRTPY